MFPSVEDLKSMFVHIHAVFIYLFIYFWNPFFWTFRQNHKKVKL